MMLGGLLAVVARTKALETGIKILVRKMHGKEYLLIAILMLLFSVLGTTYGFLEESVGFYILIAATMFAAGLPTGRCRDNPTRCWCWCARVDD